MALPAGFIMRRYGYKTGIVFGLLLFSIGAFLFYPAADARMFGFFLFALFIIASGLTFLETAANPYITVLGNPATATQRLNFAQSFNGLAATVAPLVGGLFILSGKTATDRQITDPGAFQQYLQQEADSVKIPYIVIGLLVLLVAVIIWKTTLPEIKENKDVDRSSVKLKSIWGEKNLLQGAMAQFFYVGAQVCISSFFIRFLDRTADIPEKTAAFYLSIALLFFMIGRFIGTYMMRYVSAKNLLIIYSIACMLLVTVAILAGNMAAVYAMIAVQFFMSIMFPTIFALSIQELGPKTKLGSSIIIMSIVGGAILPLLMGRLSDVSNIQVAYVVPALCFAFVLYFAIKTKSAGTSATIAHT